MVFWNMLIMIRQDLRIQIHGNGLAGRVQNGKKGGMVKKNGLLRVRIMVLN